MAKGDRCTPNCTCAICGKQMYRSPKEIAASRNGLTCSKPCQYANHRPVFSDDAKARMSAAARTRTGDRNHKWKGGVTYSDGYRMILRREHPKAHKGYVLEHVLVMEQVLGRHLTKGELVHHMNHDRADNRPENLMIVSRKQHPHEFHDTPRDERGRYTC